MAIEIGIFNNGSFDLPVVDNGDGVFYLKGDLQATQEAAQRSLISQVRQAILAEELGYDGWYQSEHHFQAEGAEFSPNPLLVEAAIATRTRRIRLGQAANIVVWWHPVRLAEQIAMLDIISGGRTEVGLGRGYQSRETETLGRPYGSAIQDQERNRRSFEEAYEIIMKAWTEPSFRHVGENFAIPPSYTKWNHAQTIAYFNQPGGVGRDIDDVLELGKPDMYSSGPPVLASTTTLKELQVYPQPLQKPHPQCWMPLTSPRSIKWAAENGFNGYFNVEVNSRMRENVKLFHHYAEQAGFPDRQDRGEFKFGWDAEKRRGVSITRYVHIVEGDVGNMEKARQGLGAQWSFYHPFGFASVLAEADEDLYPPTMPVTPEYLIDKGVGLYGSKDFVIEKLLGIKETVGLDDFSLNVWFEHSGMTTEEVEEQMRFFAQEVAPVLRRECGGGVELPISDPAKFGPFPSDTPVGAS